MKKADDFIKDFWGNPPQNDIISFYDIGLVIKYAQEDAIRCTVKECISNANLNVFNVDESLLLMSVGTYQDLASDDIVKINRLLLESVADKLIKEL